jgi:hypothetical protein
MISGMKKKYSKLQHLSKEITQFLLTVYRDINFCHAFLSRRMFCGLMSLKVNPNNS